MQKFGRKTTGFYACVSTSSCDGFLYFLYQDISMTTLARLRVTTRLPLGQVAAVAVCTGPQRRGKEVSKTAVTRPLQG